MGETGSIYIDLFERRILCVFVDDKCNWCNNQEKGTPGNKEIKKNKKGG